MHKAGFALELDARPYAGRPDLPLLVEFASETSAARFPLATTWHPGDLVWALKGAFDQPQDARLWLSGSGIEAVAWFVEPAAVWIEARPRHEGLIADAIAWAEDAVRAGPADPGRAVLAVHAFEQDYRRIAVLEASGYGRARPEGFWFHRDLAKPLPQVQPPAGFVVHDCVGIDPFARASVHRDAWSDLAHIGIPDARSSFTGEVYRSLTTGPVYDPALDIVVTASDGRLAANCLCWADTPSRIGVLEPVGTSPAFRRQGLARLAILEGLRRLRARGMACARVNTPHFNTPAITMYLSCGFRLFDRSSWWSKPVGVRR